MPTRLSTVPYPSGGAAGAFVHQLSAICGGLAAPRTFSLQCFDFPCILNTPKPEKCHTGSGRGLQEVVFGLSRSTGLRTDSFSCTQGSDLYPSLGESATEKDLNPALPDSKGLYLVHAVGSGFLSGVKKGLGATGTRADPRWRLWLEELSQSFSIRARWGAGEASIPGGSKVRAETWVAQTEGTTS